MTDLDELTMRVTGLVKRKFGHKLDIGNLEHGSLLFSGTGLSSVDAIEFVVELENEFGVFFDDDDLDTSQLQTIRSTAEVLNRLLRRQKT